MPEGTPLTLQRGPLANCKGLCYGKYTIIRGVLNYVDTFEKEETINLQQVADALIALEKEIQTADAQIANYCKQLSIATPF